VLGRLRERISHDRTPPGDVPMLARFADIDGCSVATPSMAVPEAALHVARTIGAPDPAFVAEIAEPRPAATWQPFVATVPEAELRGPDPAVYRDGLLVYESLWDRDHFLRSHARLERARHAPVVGADRAATILSLWYDNYYHWLVDVLPRLAVLRAAGVPELPVVTPAQCTSFQDGSLRSLGITDRRLPFAGPRMTFDTLVWPSGLDPIGFPSPRTAAWLRHAFLADLTPGSPRTRLYVRRSSRTIANELEVSEVLERFGLDAVQPETLSFAEQVRLFSEAELVLGCHGAGMANSVFARPGARIIELFQPGYVNLSTYRLARSAGMRYRYLVGRAAGPRRRGKDRDIVVDTVPLVSLLAAPE
jgi:capsular polysaccharide biosynthesis protein